MEKTSVLNSSLVLLILMILFLSGWATADAQEATPPVQVPCAVEPRSATAVMELLYNPAGTPVDMPSESLQFTEESDFPSGEEVDDATIGELDDLVQQYAACINSGDFLRYSALYTEELLLQQGYQIYWPREDVVAMLESGLEAAAPESKLVIGPAYSVRLLEDGRVGAAYVFEHGDAAENAFIVFEQQDGQWRLDEIYPSVAMNPVAPVSRYQVVAEYPHDPDAFTQGLVISNGELFEGTGLEGESTLRKVELDSGDVLQMRELDEEYFGEGIAVLNGRIYQLTWRSGVAFVYDAETFELLKTFSYEGEGWGLTTDGERLIMSNGTNTLVFRDPETFAVAGQIDVRDSGIPVPDLNELEYVDGEIWANVWQTDRVARIDPASGQVIGWIDLSGLLSEEEREGHDVDVLNGIAYEPESGRIFVTGKLWPNLFEIELVPAG
jgi:glutamine cyclotransferase